MQFIKQYFFQTDFQTARFLWLMSETTFLKGVQAPSSQDKQQIVRISVTTQTMWVTQIWVNSILSQN